MFLRSETSKQKRLSFFCFLFKSLTNESLLILALAHRLSKLHNHHVILIYHTAHLPHPHFLSTFCEIIKPFPSSPNSQASKCEAYITRYTNNDNRKLRAPVETLFKKLLRLLVTKLLSTCRCCKTFLIDRKQICSIIHQQADNIKVP